MKYALALVAGISLAACTTETMEIKGAEVTRSTVGIDFASMPVGTQAHYKNSKGDTWVERYVGQKGRFFVMENVFEGQVTRTMLYNADGTLYRREYADGNVRTFAPKRCLRVLGDCSFRVTNTKPERQTSSSVGNLVQAGSWFTYTYGPADGSRSNVFKYQLGEFNLIARGQSGDYKERLVKVVKP